MFRTQAVARKCEVVVTESDRSRISAERVMNSLSAEVGKMRSRAELDGARSNAAAALTNTGDKNGTFCLHFLHKKDHFTKTGSGQTYGTHSKRDVFLQSPSSAQTLQRRSASPGRAQRRTALLQLQRLPPHLAAVAVGVVAMVEVGVPLLARVRRPIVRRDFYRRAWVRDRMQDKKRQANIASERGLL